MGRKRINAVYDYFFYDKEKNLSTCLVSGCQQNVKGQHGTNLMNHLSRHEEEFITVVTRNKTRAQKENIQQIQRTDASETPRALTAKSRWNNMRDQYRKTLKRSFTKSGQRIKQPKLYKYDEQLSFLKPFFHERDSKGTSENPDLILDDDEMRLCIPGSDESLHSEAGVSPCIDGGTPALVPSPPHDSEAVYFTPSLYAEASTSVQAEAKQNKKRPRKTTESLIEYLLQREASRTEHPIDAFLVGISATLKNLSPYYQNLAKSEIFGIAQKYEMQMFKENHKIITTATRNDDVHSNFVKDERSTPEVIEINQSDHIS